MFCRMLQLNKDCTYLLIMCLFLACNIHLYIICKTFMKNMKYTHLSIVNRRCFIRNILLDKQDIKKYYDPYIEYNLKLYNLDSYCSPEHTIVDNIGSCLMNYKKYLFSNFHSENYIRHNNSCNFHYYIYHTETDKLLYIIPHLVRILPCNSYSVLMMSIQNSYLDKVCMIHRYYSILHCIQRTESDHSRNRLYIPINILHIRFLHLAKRSPIDTQNNLLLSCIHYSMHCILHTLHFSHRILSYIQYTHLHHRLYRMMSKGSKLKNASSNHRSSSSS